MADEKREGGQWWRSIAPHVLVTWALMSAGFVATWAIKFSEIDTTTEWRVEHQKEYNEVVRSVDDLDRRMKVMETGWIESKQTDKENTATLNRLDKQMSALVPEMRAMAEQMRDLARRLEKRGL